MFGLNYLYNKSCELTSWAFSCFSAPSAQTTEKVEKIVQPENRMSIFSLGYYWLNHWSPDIKRDYAEITVQWKTIRMNNSGLNKLNNSDLESSIALFLKRYNFKDNPKLYTAVYNLGIQITQKPSEIIEDMTGSQIIMHDDGHCLFDAFASAYLKLDNTTEEVCTYTSFPREHLRKRVVKFQKENYQSDEILQINLNEAIKEYKEKTLKNFDDDIKAHGENHIYAGQTKTSKQRKEAFEKLAKNEAALRNDYWKNMEMMNENPMWGRPSGNLFS